MRACLAVLLLGSLGAPSAAQYGSLSGRVRESWGRGVGVGAARVEVVGTSLSVETDFKGRYTFHALPTGWHSVRVVAAGYAPAQQDSAPVFSGTRTGQDFFLAPDSGPAGARVPAAVIDPDARFAGRRFTDLELASLPVSDVTEAFRFWPGVSRQGLRAGRPGSQALVIDGIPIRPAYDAARTPLGLRVPLALVREAGITGHAGREEFSALTNSVGLVTQDGSRAWNGGLTYATDRFVAGSADLGFDRFAAHAGGPVGRARFLVAADAVGRLQMDAHGLDAGEAGTPLPWLLSHNRGESLDAAATLSLPLGDRGALKVLGVRSSERRELFDPAFKYSGDPGAARTTDVTLVGLQVRRVSPTSTAALRLSYFQRTVAEGQLAIAPDPQFGALGGAYDIRGLDLARNRDTLAAQAGLPNVAAPQYSVDTPWGVAAFFLSGDSHGDLLWSSYREVRAHASFSRGGQAHATLAGDVGVTFASASGFQRVLGFLPVGDSVPPATAFDATPFSATVGARFETIALGRTELIGGLRVDAASAGMDAVNDAKVSLSPHVGLIVPVGHGTLWLTGSGVTQPQSLEYLSNGSFTDSLAGGRFRLGNPVLGSQTIATLEAGVGAPIGRAGVVRLAGFRRRFTGLVRSTAATPADSSRLSDDGHATVSGALLAIEAPFGQKGRWSASYAVESGDFAAEHGYRQAAAVGEARTIHRVAVVTSARLPWGVDVTGVAQYSSAVPFPTTSRPASPQFSLDAHVRRSWRIGARRASVSVEVRNLLNRRNLESPALDAAAIASLAQEAYNAAPDPIPYDSPRYRSSADLDDNGVVEGATELLPLFQSAARDYAQPLLLAGSPRTIRFGLSIEL